MIGDFIVEQLVKTIDDKGHRATGDLQASIKSVVKASGSDYEITITGKDYAKFVDKGVPKGTMVSAEALAKWIEVKGIATGELEVKNLAFAIQRKIFNEGSIQFRQKKKGFIDVMLDANAKKIFQMVLDLFKTEITVSLTNTIRKQQQTFRS